MIELQTFAAVGLLRGGAHLAGREIQPRRLALLSILAASGSSGVSREKLIELLWPEHEADRARHALAQWLFLLRRDLGASDIIVGGAVLRMNPERIAADVWQFEDAMFRNDHATAASLYRGPFLDGFLLEDSPEFEHWATRERARLQAQAAIAFESEARPGGAAGSHTHAASFSPSHHTDSPESIRSPTSPSRAQRDAPEGVADPYLSIIRERLVEHFDVSCTVGRTSVVTVFSGEDRRTAAGVTLRVVLPEVAARTDGARLVEMLQRAAAVEHDHLAPLGDVARIDDLIVLAAPPRPGTSLRDRLAVTPQLPLREAVGIASAIAEALAHGQHHDVAHLDLAPRRVLLTPTVPLLLELGIMQAITAATRATAVESGAVMGNPTYLSPEQLAGESDGDSRSDVYSLGCILYQMLAGEPPHGRAGGRLALVRRLRDAPIRIRDIRDTVPPVVEELLLQTLARSPADRLPSMIAFRDELRSILQGEVV